MACTGRASRLQAARVLTASLAQPVAQAARCGFRHTVSCRPCCNSCSLASTGSPASSCRACAPTIARCPSHPLVRSFDRFGLLSPACSRCLLATSAQRACIRTDELPGVTNLRIHDMPFHRIGPLNPEEGRDLRPDLRLRHRPPDSEPPAACQQPQCYLDV